eukprot:352476-Chlamydomonas_euryale.AAC.17
MHACIDQFTSNTIPAQGGASPTAVPASPVHRADRDGGGDCADACSSVMHAQKGAGLPGVQTQSQVPWRGHTQRIASKGSKTRAQAYTAPEAKQQAGVECRMPAPPTMQLPCPAGGRLALSPNGKSVVFAMSDGIRRVDQDTKGRTPKFNEVSGDLAAKVSAIKGEVKALAFTPDGAHLALGFASGELRVVEWPSLKPKFLLRCVWGRGGGRAARPGV